MLVPFEGPGGDASVCWGGQGVWLPGVEVGVSGRAYLGKHLTLLYLNIQTVLRIAGAGTAQKAGDIWVSEE